MINYDQGLIAALSNKKIWVLLVLILLLGAALRLPFLESIPAYQVDEGSWNIGARDKVLEGNWCYHIRKFCVSPVHGALFYIWFLIWSPGLLTARLLSVILDLGCIVLMYLIGRRLFDNRIGLIAAFLYTVNSVILLNARRAMLETDTTFWVLLTFLLFMDRKLLRRFLAGITMVLAIGTKLYAFKLLAVFGIYEMLQFWDDRRWRSFRVLFGRPFLLFLAVTVMGTVVIYSIVYHAYPLEFQTERTSYASPFSLIPNLTGPDSLLLAIKSYLLCDGMIIALALIAVLFMFGRWRKEHDSESVKSRCNIWFLFHWTWIISLSVAMMNYQPPRYYVMIVPAYILLASVIIARELFKRQHLIGWIVLCVVLLYTVAGNAWYYFIAGHRNTSAPAALTWVQKNIPNSKTIAADYYMAVSLRQDEIYPLHPQRYYTLSPDRTWSVDDYFTDPFGLPDYYTKPVPGHFLKRNGYFPDYVLMPVNHGGTGGRLRFDRFMRSPKFTDNYTIVKEFPDPYRHKTILYTYSPPPHSIP
jgi:4-amino-4-deoxy-L-arabinose transferase-like glycosyltransferase